MEHNSSFYLCLVGNNVVLILIRVYYNDPYESLGEPGVLIFFLSYCCAGWGYIAAFTKLLRIHKI
jgi:hypothetical protein